MPSQSDATVRAYFGHHRSGSTWIYRVLRELVQEELASGVLYAPGEREFGGDLRKTLAHGGVALVCYTNANYASVRGVPVRGVHVVRDPRDVLVSAYFAHAMSHPTDGWPDLEEFRAVLASCSVEQGMLLELEFCANVYEDMRTWPVDAPGVRLMRFEDLAADPIRGFEAIVEQLGFADMISPEAVRRIVERHSFEVLSGGRPRGENDPTHHYRRGLPGEWRERFGTALAWAFAKRYGDLLTHYGYEHDASWWRRLESARAGAGVPVASGAERPSEGD